MKRDDIRIQQRQQRFEKQGTIEALIDQLSKCETLWKDGDRKNREKRSSQAVRAFNRLGIAQSKSSSTTRL